MRRAMWTLLAGAMLTMAVAVLGAQGNGACNRDCMIGLTEAYLSAMVARDPAKAPVTANVRFTQNTRPMSLGQGVWESIKGVRGYQLFVADPTYTLPSGEIVKHSEAMLRKQAVVISELFKIEDGRIRRIEAVMAGGLPLDAASGW